MNKHLCGRIGWKYSPSFGAKVPEGNGLLGWKINNNESINAGLLTILQQPLLSITQDRIVVSHKQDWNRQSLLSCIADLLED